MGGEALSVADRVARALSRRPEAPAAKPPAPPWRDGSRPPREPTHPQQGGSRQRAAPPPPWEPTQPSGRNPGGIGMRSGLAWASRPPPLQGAPTPLLPTRLWAPATTKSEPGWPKLSASRKKLARRQKRLRRSSRDSRRRLLPSRSAHRDLPGKQRSARDRSRSARAQPQAERTKPTLTARAKTPQPFRLSRGCRPAETPPAQLRRVPKASPHQARLGSTRLELLHLRPPLRRKNTRS